MMMRFKFNISNKLAAVLVAAAMLVPVAYSGGASALTAEERLERQNAKTRIPQTRVGKKVTEAFELYSQELIEQAIQVLLEVDSAKDYDKAFLDKFIGNLYATMEDKLDEAIKYTNMAYQPDILNYKEQGEVINLLAQLYMMKRDFAKAIEKYEEWMSFTGDEDPKVYVRIASAYYELKQMDKLITPADKAIKLVREKGLEKSAAPYSLKLASYYERKMYKETVKMGEVLVKEFPAEKKNWVQLGMFYVLVEDYVRGLSTMEMAYKQGYLEKSNEFRTLAQMYSQNNLPFKAATIQEKYIKLGVMERSEQNLKHLGNYFLAAKEMTKAAQYFGEAAKISDSAYLYRRQGEMYFQAEKYSQAVVALKKALDKGIDNQGPVNITLMQSYFYQGDYKDAYAALNEADKFSNTKSQVKSWRQYIKDKAKHHGVNL